MQLFRLAHSRNFTRLLVERFSPPDGDGIPAWKRKLVARKGGSAALRNSAALRIDPEYYHLAPHVDAVAKIVTWHFHPLDGALATRRAGTLFYRPRPELAGKFEVDNSTDTKGWFMYEYFEPVKEMRVLPNSFFAFAPNSRSWHGAAVDPSQLRGAPPDARRNFLGFVTSKGREGLHHFGFGDQSAEAFWLP